MNRQQIIVSLLIVPLLATLMAYAGSYSGQQYAGYAIFAACVVLAFAINTAAFLPAYALQTEKFYDLVGSLTYISMIVCAVQLSKTLDSRAALAAALVVIWALRLGTFLFTRIHRVGQDQRFATIKTDFLRFLNAWGLQALWATLTVAPALVIITTQKRVEMDILGWIGLAVWLLGFSIEVVADYQKSQFRKDPKNKDQFIQTGLWSRSQHPNYFGEITLWTGITIMALPVLQGWQWAVLISPLFVTMLLTRVSGVPMLQAKAKKKWGGQEAYEKYRTNTPLLVPRWW